MKKNLLTVLSFILLFSTLSLGQTLTMGTYGVSPRDVAADAADIFDRAYNGLVNVGVETQMYFQATVGDQEVGDPAVVIPGDLAAVAWTLKSRPAGSAAAIGVTADIDEDTQVMVFTPDVKGTYVIEVTDGVNTLNVTINAGTYLGIETGNCVLCHESYVTAWEETGHYSIFETKLNDPGHYTESCISCHTTGYDTNANNGGFDDHPFVFPAVRAAGTFDQLVQDFPDAMQLGRIQCESCHGPGLGHGGATSMAVTLDIENCAWCHDSGTHHAFPEQWDHSGHDATEFDGRGFHGGHAIGAFMVSANRTSCAACHSGAGFIQWLKEGKPVDSNGLPGSVSVLPEPTTISCAVCHDPHSDELPYQLRMSEIQLGDGTAVSSDTYGTGVQCMTCHRSRRNAVTYANNTANASSHYGAHHGPQADMLLGKNAPDFGIDFPTSPHAVAVPNSCVGCHMHGNDHVADADGNIILVGGHSFNMNDADGNDNVAACADCHGDVGQTFKEKKYYVNGNADLDGDGTAEGLQEEVHGLMAQLHALLPLDANGNVSITGDNLTVADMMGGYVYMWVEEDRSFGIHNPAFTVSLLKAAIEYAGGITSIDYPEDYNSTPAEFSLAQNYPNPFNPTTNIQFSIPESGNVRITVYDSIGREVAVLVNSDMSAGSHEVTWNAVNMSSGIYFYKMQSNDFVTIKKMLLMK